MPFLRSDALLKIGWGFLSGHFFNGIGITLAQFEQAVANNPFTEAQTEPKTLHVFFLAERSTLENLDVLTALKKDNESFSLLEQVFYLHAPDGIGRSKLAVKVEKTLGVPTTARNWNTVSKLLTLASVN